MTATGVEKILPALGVEALARQGGSRKERLGAALNFLDKMAPGAIAGAVSFLGEPAELEGRKATKMPLRFWGWRCDARPGETRSNAAVVLIRVVVRRIGAGQSVPSATADASARNPARPNPGRY